ncbi:MAG: hypothetical protein JXA90_15405 [Planctomycetes bacterium]|nr:hypothetical protein [Planctomycetota bacterium]
MKSDSPIVDEVRQRRSEVSARFGDDLDRYVKHLMELQEKTYRARLVGQIAVVPVERPARPPGPRSTLDE